MVCRGVVAGADAGRGGDDGDGHRGGNGPEWARGDHIVPGDGKLTRDAAEAIAATTGELAEHANGLSSLRVAAETAENAARDELDRLDAEAGGWLARGFGHACTRHPLRLASAAVPGVDQFRERVPRRAGLHLRREGASRDAVDADAARQSRHRAGGASKRRISLRSPPDGRGSGIRGVRRGEARRRDPDARGRRGDKRRRRMRDTRFLHPREK